jgi:hypothetical protein
MIHAEKNTGNFPGISHGTRERVGAGTDCINALFPEAPYEMAGRDAPGSMLPDLLF